jgi:hypothetical protein
MPRKAIVTRLPTTSLRSKSSRCAANDADVPVHAMRLLWGLLWGEMGEAGGRLA